MTSPTLVWINPPDTTGFEQMAQGGSGGTGDDADGVIGRPPRNRSRTLLDTGGRYRRPQVPGGRPGACPEASHCARRWSACQPARWRPRVARGRVPSPPRHPARLDRVCFRCLQPNASWGRRRVAATIELRSLHLPRREAAKVEMERWVCHLHARIAARTLNDRDGCVLRKSRRAHRPPCRPMCHPGHAGDAAHLARLFEPKPRFAAHWGSACTSLSIVQRAMS
jgi:hypothetical protein